MVRKQIPSERSGILGRESGIEPYEKERQKKSIGKYMRTFAQTRKKEIMTTYDDVDYLTMLCSSVSSANCAYFADACEEAYTRGQKVGNMKDEVADQKTAFTDTCDYMFEILLELSAQWPLVNLLANFPKQDTISTSAGTFANFNDATMTDILQRMQNLEVPQVVVEVLKRVNFLFKFSDGWQDVHHNDIPARYVAYRVPFLASASIVTLVNLVWAEQGEFKNHCQKFGIKTVKFSSEWLKPRIISPNSKDGLAYFQHAMWHMRNGANTTDLDYMPLYPFNADGSEAKKWWFYDDPNESELNYLAKLYQPYEGTYNKYGGALAQSFVKAAANIAGFGCKFTEGTAMTARTLAQIFDIAMEFLTVWENAGNLNLELTGLGPTNFDIDLNNVQFSWARSAKEALYYGTGIDEQSSDQTLISFLIGLMF